MQAIVTKYLGPTDTRGSRVKATADAGSIMVPWDSALGIADNHAAAARAFAVKFGWSGSWVGGSLVQAVGGYAFVNTDTRGGPAFVVAK